MPKKRRISITVTLVTIVLLTLPVLHVQAQDVFTQIEVAYRNIQVVVNGDLLACKDTNGAIVEPFIYQGTTYVPLRAISEAYNLDVDWDSESNTITINSNTNAFSPVNGLQYTQQVDGRISIIYPKDTEKIVELTTDDMWSKMKLQVFFVPQHPSGVYWLYEDNQFKPLPGQYTMDNGDAEFYVSDIDGNGVFELLYITHCKKAHVDYYLLNGYAQGMELISKIGITEDSMSFDKMTTGNRFLLINSQGLLTLKLDDNTLSIIPPEGGFRQEVEQLLNHTANVKEKMITNQQSPNVTLTEVRALAKQVTKNMTHGDVYELLGLPQTFYGSTYMSDYYQYEEFALVISYDRKDNKETVSGVFMLFNDNSPTEYIIDPMD